MGWLCPGPIEGCGAPDVHYSEIAVQRPIAPNAWLYSMSVQSASDAARILPAIRVLYAAAIDGNRWPEFLQTITVAFDAKSAHVIRVQPRDAALSFSALYGYDEAILARYGSEGGLAGAITRYQQHFMQLLPTDPRVRIIARYPGRPLSCRPQIAEEELHAPQVHRDMLKLGDVEYSLLVSLPEDDGSLIILGVFRGKSAEDFNETDVEHFSEIIPHLKQAVRVSEHLADASFKAQAARDVLDGLAVGLVLVDRDARIVWANNAGRRIMDSEDGVSDIGGSVKLHAQSETAALRRLISTALQKARDSTLPPAAAMTATRPSGREPLGIVVGSVRRTFGEISAGGLERPLAVLFVSLPEEPIEVPAELLRRLYGLTLTEARICERLVDGQTPQSIAAALGIAVDTCRTHLKHIFQKLDVSSQPETVAKVMASPLWMRRRSGRATSPAVAFTRH